MGSDAVTYPLKRPLDLAIALSAVIVLSPVMLVIALSVAARLGRPIVFKQARSGLHGASFVMYKFRTMAETRDAQGRLLPEEERLTTFGRFLRATSLDELPELFNVLRGEMSLVGPRPLLTRYLQRYSPEQARRHAVRPGITGWAQVNGRTTRSWQEKFALDVWYVDNSSLALDLKILALTVWKTVKREHVTAPGQWEEFMG